jgi:type IV secretion system protein VirB5
MNLRMKYLAMAFGVAMGTFAGSATAQWATFDVSNFMQNLQQVQQLNQSLQEMQNQLAQLKQQTAQAQQTYSSMTGSRGMGNLVRSSVGDYQTGLYNQGQSNTGAIAQLAASIKEKAGYLSTQDMSGINSAYQQRLQQNGDAAANQQAQAQMVFQHSGEEFQNIQSLMGEIDQTQDPKAIADLQARIQIQQVTLQNQLLQAQAMAAMTAAQDRVDQQRESQEIMSMKHDYYKGQ